MDIGCGEKSVNPMAGGGFHRVISPLDVLFSSACQPGDGHRLPGFASFGQRTHFLRDAAHGFKIAGGGDGKTGFAHIHAEAGELPRDFQFLIDIQSCAGALFAIAQGGIKNNQGIFFYRYVRV